MTWTLYTIQEGQVLVRLVNVTKQSAALMTTELMREELTIPDDVTQQPKWQIEQTEGGITTIIVDSVGVELLVLLENSVNNYWKG